MKDKARALVDRFRDYAYSYELADSEEDTEEYNAKQCALIAVDEILDMDLLTPFTKRTVKILEYYREVKQEIQKI